MTKHTKCPKCGAKKVADAKTYKHFACGTSSMISGLNHVTDTCKLRVTRRQLRKEKARMDALEAHKFRITNDTRVMMCVNTHDMDYVEAPTLRQLADKLLKS